MGDGRGRMPSGATTKKESASDAGERMEEKSGGAVGLRRLEYQGRGSSIQRISCPGTGSTRALALLALPTSAAANCKCEHSFALLSVSTRATFLV